VVIEADLPGGTARAHTVSVENTGAATLGVKKSAAAVSNATTETFTDNATFTKATSVTVDIPEFTDWNAASTLTATKATSVTLGGKGDVGDTGAKVTISAPEATSMTLNQTAADQSWFVEYSKGSATTSPLTSLTVTSAGTSGIDLGTTDDLRSKLQSFTLSNAGAVNIGTSGASANGNMTELSSLSLTGTSTSASFTAGNIGSTTQAYAVSVTGSGEAAGLTLGNINTAASQTITLDLKAVTGNTDIGSVNVANSSGAYTGTVTINASGHGNKSTAGTLTIGDVANAETIQGGTVSIDVTGAKGAVVLGGGGILGNAVSILASTAESTVSLGTITAKNSLTLEVPASKAVSGQTVTIGSGSTAFTGSLRGSIDNDTFTFNSANTSQTSITLSGDLRDGTNTLTVNATASTATAGQTIDISGLTNVTSSTIRGAVTNKNVLKGGAGNDVLFGGSKADFFTGGGGNDTFTLNNITHTGTVTIADLQTSSKFAASKTVATTDLDVILDWSGADKLSIDGFTNVALASTTRATYGTTAYSAATGTLLNGSYSQSGNTFTTSTTGSDTLFLFDSSVTTTSRAIVIVGFSTGFSVDTTAGSSGMVGTST